VQIFPDLAGLAGHLLAVRFPERLQSRPSALGLYLGRGWTIGCPASPARRCLP